MARIEQTIDINVPAHVAYMQLTRFEEYPRFMQDVEAVRQVDDAHLHWSARMADRRMEWDAEITERDADRCIAWRNTSGPQSAGRLELEALGQETARVLMIMDCEPGQLIAGAEGDPAAAMAKRLEQDLVRFKQLLESGAGQALQQAGQTAGLQAAQPVTSAPALSQSSDDDSDDGRFSVAAEQNFDEQSDAARRIGQLPEAVGVAGKGDAAGALAKSLQQDGESDEQARQLRNSMDRAVPRAD